MLNRLIEWWARNSVAANLMMFGIIIIGIIQALRMEREVFPSFPVNGASVSMTWRGASPEDVEEQLVIRVEESLSDLEGIDWISSSAFEGGGSVNIRTLPSVDMTQFLNDVKSRVDAISSFPRDIEPPRVVQWFNRGEFMRIAVTGDMAERPLKRLAENLRQEVAALPGLSLVELFGIRNEEVSVEVSEEALRRYGLTIANVADAIRTSSLNLSSGTVRTDSGSFSLTIRNMADTQAEFGAIIVRQTPEGGIIRVRDVAEVIDGFEDNPLLATMNGKPAVLIQALTTENMNITLASDSVAKWMEEVKPRLPEGIDLVLWQNDAEAFNSRIGTITSSAFQGLILVLIVLLLTLRPKVAWWVTVGIATAYAGAFIFLPVFGVSVNMLSTFAFLLVLGIVVDDAIVVGESIHSESQKTGGGLTAAVLGTQIVAKPVIFAVLTTILAFVPWLMFDSEVSQSTRHITYVVVFALSFSLLESLLILPAHLRKMKPRDNDKAGIFGRFQKKVAQSLVWFAHNPYRKMAIWAVEKRYLCLSLFVAILIVSFFGILGPGYVRSGFQPEIEADQISIEVVMPQGNTYERSLEVLEQLQTAQEALVRELTAENSNFKLVENWYTRSRRENVLAIVKLVPPEVRSLSARDAALQLREKIGDIPDAEEVTVNYGLNDAGPALEFSIRHPDLATLRLAVAELEAELATFDVAYDIRTDLQSASDEIQFSLKPGAEQLGLTLAQVSNQVRQAYFGEEVQRLPREAQDVRVMVRYPQDDRESIESLTNFRIRTNDGREVPLLSVVDVTYAPGIDRINRRDKRRAARVSADLKEEVRGDIIKKLETEFYPAWEARYPQLEHGPIGQAEGEQRFFAELTSYYLFAFFLMYALLAIAFTSYSQPILFLVAIPFAVVGAVLGHWMMGEVVSVFSYFGIAAAAGVVINDNLVLIDYTNRLRERGMSAVDAIIEAGAARFRPILLTSLTTIVGLVPLMLERSTQAAFLKPVAIALSFGVGIALFVTLLLVPSLYVIGHDVKGYFSRSKSVYAHIFTKLKPAKKNV